MGNSYDLVVFPTFIRPILDRVRVEQLIVDSPSSTAVLVALEDGGWLAVGSLSGALLVSASMEVACAVLDVLVRSGFRVKEAAPSEFWRECLVQS